MADGVTVMVVVRVDGDGRCGMGDGPGPYRPYYASYSSNFGSSWSSTVPLTGTGCARPRLLSLGSGKPMVLSGGRLCTEHMTGLFVWLNLAGTPNGEWQRYSLSYQHNLHWRGDPSFKFDDRVNSSDIFETQAYTSLMQVDESSFVVTCVASFHLHSSSGHDAVVLVRAGITSIGQNSSTEKTAARVPTRARLAAPPDLRCRSRSTLSSAITLR